MMYKKVRALAFSPCGTTKETAEIFAKALAETLDLPYEYTSFTLPDERKCGHLFASDEIAVIAMPTYAGRVPNKIAPDLAKNVKGSGGMAIPIVTYGNRAYENSLAELKSILAGNGFCCVAAAVVLNEHSMFGVAEKRPDKSDAEELKSFAARLAGKVCPICVENAITSPKNDVTDITKSPNYDTEKISELTDCDMIGIDKSPNCDATNRVKNDMNTTAKSPNCDISKKPRNAGNISANLLKMMAENLKVPGDANAAYYVPKKADGGAAKILPVKPKTDSSKCTGCKTCVSVCPMGAIEPGDVSEVSGTCIKCFACVRLCPAAAKYFDDPDLLSHKELIRKTCTARKENEFFIG